MKSIVVLSALLFLASPAQAQLEWFRATPQTSLSVEYLQPNFAEDPNGKMTGSIVLLAARFAVSEGARFVVEVPYVTTSEEYTFLNYGYDYTTNTYTMTPFTQKTMKSGLGNIGIGVELGSSETNSSGHVLVSIPTMSRETSFAGWSGMLGDFPHFQRYNAEVLIVAAGYEYHPLFESGFRVSANLEPSVWIPTRDGDVEGILNYGGGFGYDNGTLRLGLGLGSRWILTEERFMGAKTSFHHLIAEASVRIGIIEPGITFLRQLDKELNRSVENTLGLNVRVSL